MKTRIDIALEEKFNIKSRQKAKALIMAGSVFIGQKKILKPGTLINEEQISNLTLIEKDPWVSRGAYKLIGAIRDFSLNLKDKICLDIGSSTGGFTQVMLDKEALKVYAVDVGTNQMDYSLRTDKRVILKEKTNMRYLKKEDIYEEIDFFTIDVSFISVKKIIPNTIKFLQSNSSGVILVKPQFESKKEEVIKGIIKDKKIHKRVVKEMILFFEESDFNVESLTYSDIKGTKGNIEYLLYVKRGFKKEYNLELIDELILKSHRRL